MPGVEARARFGTFLAAAALVLALGASGSARAETAPKDPEFAAAKRAYDASEFPHAAKLLRPLAEKGNPSAQFLYGELLFFGLGVERDDAKAAEWYAGAARAGNTEAMYRLGYLYATAHGVPYDPATAERYWLRAANKGHRGAIVILGDFYNEGLYRKEDEVLARRWLNRAAMTGDIESMYKLARRLMKPEKIATDFRRAYAWLYIAAYRGHVGAQNFLKKFQQVFAPHEVKRGTIWGKAYIQKGTPVPAPPGES